MKSVVISIGGSVVLSQDVNYLKKLSDLINKLSNYYKIFLVVGGGRIAREYIKLGRELGFDEKTLDNIGIDITRINAKILSRIVKKSNIEIPNSTNKAIKFQNNIVIMGGTSPGHSTDMVSAELAEKANSEKLIIATNVDGIYDKDPNKFSDVKKYDEIHIDELISKYGISWKSAGANMVIDSPALKIIKRSSIKTYVLNGIKLDQLEKVIFDRDFIGTKIIV